MINPSFQAKFPFAYNYFTQILNLSDKGIKPFPQALIFEGEDTVSQYLFALELARNLNCKLRNKNTKNTNTDLQEAESSIALASNITDSEDFNPISKHCDCPNCKWIKTHSHPAVNNVSQIHFKGENDETKTVISVKQALEIEKNLTLSSDYHRFFIFFSSGEKELEEFDRVEFEKTGYNSNINFSIEPLNISTFHPTTPNALLKSIEEPPKNTTFVFLTKSKENILQTIVSRCLVFKLSGKRKQINYDNILNYLNSYPDINFNNALDITSGFLEIISTQDETLESLLNKFLEFLKDLLKNSLKQKETNQNPQNQNLINKIQNDIKLIKNAMKMSGANMQDKIILETLMLQIARGY